MKKRISQGASKRINRKKKQTTRPALGVSIQEVNDLEKMVDFMTQEGPVINKDGSISIFSPAEFECSPEFEKIMQSSSDQEKE